MSEETPASRTESLDFCLMDVCATEQEAGTEYRSDKVGLPSQHNRCLDALVLLGTGPKWN